MISVNCQFPKIFGDNLGNTHVFAAYVKQNSDVVLVGEYNRILPDTSVLQYSFISIVDKDGNLKLNKQINTKMQSGFQVPTLRPRRIITSGATEQILTAYEPHKNGTEIFLMNMRAIDLQIYQILYCQNDLYNQMTVLWNRYDKITYIQFRHINGQDILYQAYSVETISLHYKFLWEKRLTLPSSMHYESFSPLYMKISSLYIYQFGIDSTKQVVSLRINKQTDVVDPTTFDRAVYIQFQWQSNFKATQRLPLTHSPTSGYMYFCAIDNIDKMVETFGLTDMSSFLFFEIFASDSSSQCQDIGVSDSIVNNDTGLFDNETMHMMVSHDSRITLYQFLVTNITYLVSSTSQDIDNVWYPLIIMGVSWQISNKISGTPQLFSSIRGVMKSQNADYKYIYGTTSSNINCFYQGSGTQEYAFVTMSSNQNRCSSFSYQYSNSSSALAIIVYNVSNSVITMSYNNVTNSIDILNSSLSYIEPVVSLTSQKTKCIQFPGYTLQDIYFDPDLGYSQIDYILPKKNLTGIVNANCSLTLHYNITYALFNYTIDYNYNYNSTTAMMLTVLDSPVNITATPKYVIHLQISDWRMQLYGYVIFNLYTSCPVTSLPTHVQTIKFTYTINQKPIDYELSKLFKLNLLPSLCKKIGYNISATSAQEKVDTEIVALITSKIRIYTQDESKVKQYRYQVELLLANLTVAKVYVNIDILPPIRNQSIINPNKIDDCSMYDIQILSLASDTFEMPDCFFVLQNKNFIIDVSVNSVKRFARYAYNTFFLEPSLQDEGIYPMKIILRDSNFKPVNQEYNFKIFVLPKDNVKIKCTDSDQKNCRPRIASVSNTGLMTIEFPKKITPIDSQNYTNASAALYLKFSQTEEKNVTLQEYSIQKFTETEVQIQLTFSNPQYISMSILGKDSIQVKFINSTYFRNKDMTYEVSENYYTSSQMPPQLVNSSLSMKQIWNLINTLQILSHIPMLNITIPSNLMACLQTIIDISNISIIPKVQKLYEILKQKILFSSIITFFTKSYLKTYLNAVLGLKAFVDGDSDDLATFAFSILIFCIYTASPIMITIFLYSNRYKLEHKKFKITYGSLYPNAFTQYFDQYIWNVVFILRRLFYAIVIVFLGDYPSFQIMSQIWISYSCMFYVQKYKPFVENSDNITELLNELTCLIVFCCLTTNVASTSDTDTQVNLGFALICLIMINIMVNFVLFLKVNSVIIYGMISKLCAKIKEHRLRSKYKSNVESIMGKSQANPGNPQNDKLYQEMFESSINSVTQQDDQFMDSQEIQERQLIEDKKLMEIRSFSYSIQRLKEKRTFDEAVSTINLKMKNQIVHTMAQRHDLLSPNNNQINYDKFQQLKAQRQQRALSYMNNYMNQNQKIQIEPVSNYNNN